jgi:hypothetical protein
MNAATGVDALGAPPDRESGGGMSTKKPRWLGKVTLYLYPDGSAFAYLAGDAAPGRLRAALLAAAALPLDAPGSFALEVPEAPGPAEAA